MRSKTAMLGGRALHATQQLARGDRRDRDLVVLTDRHSETFAQEHADVCPPRRARLPLEVDEHRRV